VSDPTIFVTVNIDADTPIDVEVSNGLAVVTFGAETRVALEIADARALERLGGHTSTALARLMGQHSADPGAAEPDGGAR
jgi:hypothetical protein